MPTRSAASRIRNPIWILALLAGLAQPGCADPTPPETLTLGQARWLAVQALKSGDPGLAVQLGRGLLQADPNDSMAHYIIAAAQARLDHPRAGRRAAAKAYRTAQAPIDRFSAAQLAAKMAYAESKAGLAQLWLRRSATYAPDARAEAVVARDYRILRRKNPWAFRLRGELRPSNNVNKGADSALQVIDGVPVTGWLNGAAQALPGLIGSADLSLSYRFRRTEESATSLAGRLYLRRVSLSDAARRKSPTSRNSDFASTFAEATLRHRFALGPRRQGGSGSVEFTLGEAWWGGDRSFRFARLKGARNWRLGEGVSVNLNAGYESRFDAMYSVNDAEVVGLGGYWRTELDNGNAVTLSVALRDTKARHVNGSYRSATVRGAYSFGRPVGPVKLGAGLVLGYSDYPEFRSGGFIPVPGGRQDQSVYADLDMLFHQVDYAGFAPKMRIRAGRKTSNDSRYSMKEISVSFGIESKF